MQLVCGNKTLNLMQPCIMGIVNVTPDSFSDGGRYPTVASAIIHAKRMIADGAAIVDIGGESTRPGAESITIETELERVIPVISALKGCAAIISVDTRKPEVMQAAIIAGADMINDINALRSDGALKVVSESNVAVCVMHMQGEPKTMQQNVCYGDVIQEVCGFLQERVEVLKTAGIPQNRIAIDPGFGFGKTLQHNLQLLKHLDRIVALKSPVLVGMSRKAMLGMLTGRPVNERDAASIAAYLHAWNHGANIMRVHDVAKCRDAFTIWQAIKDTP